MPDLAAYRTLVQNLGFDGVSQSVLDASINSARRRVARDGRWSFQDKTSQSLSTTAGTATVSLSSITDLLRPNSIRLLDGTNPEISLTYMPRQVLLDYLDVDSTPAPPRFWTSRAGTVIFYPKPDKVYTLDVDYVALPADMAGSGQDPLYPDHLSDLIAFAASVDLLFRQRDMASASAADQHYRNTLLPAAFGQDKTLQRQSSRRVVSTGIWRTT